MRSNQTHPTIEDMQALWKTDLQPKLRAYEAERKREFPRRIRAFAILLAGMTGFSVLEALFDGRIQSWRDAQEVILFTFFLGVAVCTVLFLWLVPPNARKIKMLISEAAAAAWGLDVYIDQAATEGNPNAEQSWSEALNVLAQEQMLPLYTRHHLSDLVSGNRYGMRFSLIEARLFHRRGSDKETNMFAGMLLRLDWSARVHGKVWFAERASSAAASLAQDHTLVEIDTVSQVIEKRFDIFGTDPVSTLATLSPDKLEILLRIAEANRLKVPCGVIRDGALYLAFEGRDHLRLGKLHQAVDEPDTFIAALDDMMFVCNLVDALARPEAPHLL